MDKETESNLLPFVVITGTAEWLEHIQVQDERWRNNNVRVCARACVFMCGGGGLPKKCAGSSRPVVECLVPKDAIFLKP